MAHITQQDFALAAEDLVFHAMHKINQVNAPPPHLKHGHAARACLPSNLPSFSNQAADQENDRLDEQIKKLDNM
jgi:hypothetical protein